MAKIIRMPHYSKSLEKKLSSLVEFMIDKISEKFHKQVLLGMHKSTIEKFEDKQTGNYSKVFLKLSKQVTNKLLKQFSNDKIDDYINSVLDKANKFNRDKTYSAISESIGIDMKQLVAKEALSRKTNALILETSQWAKRLRDETLQDYTAMSLRQMSLGKTIDEVIENFIGIVSKKKNAAKFVARNQMSNFNGILTKIRFQKVGITRAKWETSHDESVRPCHKARNGVIFDLDKGCYSSCDGEYLTPGVDYNCRCLMIAIQEEFEEIE